MKPVLLLALALAPCSVSRAQIALPEPPNAPPTSYPLGGPVVPNPQIVVDTVRDEKQGVTVNVTVILPKSELPQGNGSLNEPLSQPSELLAACRPVPQLATCPVPVTTVAAQMPRKIPANAKFVVIFKGSTPKAIFASSIMEGKKGDGVMVITKIEGPGKKREVDVDPRLRPYDLIILR